MGTGYQQGLRTPVPSPSPQDLARLQRAQPPIPLGIGDAGTADPRGAVLRDTTRGAAEDPARPRDPRLGGPPAQGGPPASGGPAGSGGPPLGVGSTPGGAAPGAGPPAQDPEERARMQMRALYWRGGDYGGGDPVEFYLPEGVDRSRFNRTATAVVGLQDKDRDRPGAFYDYYGEDGGPLPGQRFGVDLVGGGRADIVQLRRPTPDQLENAVPG